MKTDHSKKKQRRPTKKYTWSKIIFPQWKETNQQKRNLIKFQIQSWKDHTNKTFTNYLKSSLVSIIKGYDDIFIFFYLLWDLTIDNREKQKTKMKF